MARRIKKADIKFISLCPRGQNQMGCLYKSDEGGTGSGTAEFQALLKAPADFEERGELTAVVYAPETRDKEGDIASVEVIKEMAHSFARNGANLDLRHDGKTLTKDQAFVAESFIVQKEDPRFKDFKDYEGKQVDVTEGWAVLIKIEDKAIRALYKEGKWNGVSMFGPALLELEKSYDVNEILESFVKKLKGPIEMTKEELDVILKERDKNLVAELTKALKPEPAAPAAPSTADQITALKAQLAKLETPAAPVTGIQKPIFKGDFSKVEDVKKYNEELVRYNIAKSVDFDNPESVKTYLAALTKEPVTETDEVKRLKAELAKAEGRSNQTPSDDSLVTVTKEDEDRFAFGKQLVKDHNLRRGIK